MSLIAFFNTLPGQTIYAMVGLAFLDLLLGVLAAFRDGTFRLDSVAAFIRSQLIGRVLGIALLIGGGTLLNADMLTAAGYAAAALYTAETIGSIISSWGPKNLKVLGVQRDTAQPVPTA